MSPLTVLTLALLTGGPAEDDEFSARVAMLSPDTPRDERLAAVRWILKQCARPAATKAVPAVERCAKHDADAEVRYRAVEALGMIAYQQRPRVCPLAVAEALLDKDADVRGITSGVTGLFKEFAPGSVDVFLKCARHDDANVRAVSFSLLALAAPKDEKVLATIRAGRDDPDATVRNNAHGALFLVTGKLDELAAYCLRVRAEFLDEPVPGPDAPDKAKQDRFRKNLIVLGTTTRLMELGEEQPDDVAKAVLAGLADKAPVTRRGSASFAGAVAELFAARRDGTPHDHLIVVPITEPGDPKKDKGRRDVPSKLLVRLRESGVEDRLRKVRDDDPDRAVRDAAAEALKQLAAAKAKKP
jgi:HEAT repeats